MSESTSVALTTVLFVLVAVNIVGNSLVCAIIKRNRELRTPINYLLINLALADILYAVFIAPRVFFNITSIHPDGVIGTVLCKLLTDGNIAWIGGASSIVTFVAIAIERYYAVMYPHGSKWKLTKRKLKVIIPASWVFAVLLIVPMFIVKDVVKLESGNLCMYLFPEEWMGRAYTTTWNIVFFLPLALMIGLYSKVVHTLWFKGSNDNQLTYKQQGVMRVRKRVTLMVVAVTAIFGICWGINEVVYAIQFIALYDTGPIPMAIANTLVLFNSAINPFVYALVNKQFREKIRRMLCCASSSAPRVQPTRERLSMDTGEIT
ncbi:hypothetical protein ACROYT_G038812 [Oculina patagonica]